jgi:hypothetical protein
LHKEHEQLLVAVLIGTSESLPSHQLQHPCVDWSEDMRAANSARSSVNVLRSGCASCCRESETSHVEIDIPGCIVELTQNVSCLHFLVEIVIMQKYYPVWFPVIYSLPVAHVVG